MVKLYNDIWLVVEPATPLKNDGVSSSVGMMKFHSQLFMESHSKFLGSSHHQPVMVPRAPGV